MKKRKANTQRTAKDVHSRPATRIKDGRLFLNICKGVAIIGYLAFEVIKYYVG